MNIAQNARVAVITALAALLLAGCAPAQPSPQITPADNGAPEPTISAEPDPVLDGQAAFEAAINSDVNGVDVTVIEVIDLETFRIEPTAYGKEREGYAGTFTVKALPTAGSVTPAPGACGYDEALAFATQYITEEASVTYAYDGGVRVEGLIGAMTSQGFAYGTSSDAEYWMDKAAPHKGPWADCPEFSA